MTGFLRRTAIIARALIPDHMDNGVAISIINKRYTATPKLTSKPITRVRGYRVEGSVFFEFRGGESDLEILVDDFHAELAEHLVLTVAGVVEQLAVKSSAFHPAEVVEYGCGNSEGSGSNERVSVLRHESGPFKEG